MKKSISATLSISIAFVLVSSIFSFNGNVYAQDTPITPETSFDSSTSSIPNATENATGFEQQQNQTTIPEQQLNDTNIVVDTNTTETQPVGENTTQSDSENTTSGNVVRDSVTLLLEDRSLPEGSFIHLYDSTPFEILSGHVAAKLPCNADNATDVNVLIGQAPNVSPTDLEFVPELSSGDLCLYHADLASDSANTITDIAILNNSTEDIDFPPTSTVVIGVNEIAEISSEDQ
ncbi:MAG: hypothetical protein H0X03_02790 [Nitrosopumilus sp.]|nr:hypothetical protein [Nitrosopumilus sp.]